MSESNTRNPWDGFANMPDSAMLDHGTAILTELAANANYPNPQAGLPQMKATLDEFSSVMAEALDSSEVAVAYKTDDGPG